MFNVATPGANGLFIPNHAFNPSNADWGYSHSKHKDAKIFETQAPT